jgi:DNA-binding GntR family transcriptional regulator
MSTDFRYAGGEHWRSQVSTEPLSNLDRSTLRERALEALRSAIISGRYRPGDHLGEVELASHLGVSRGTVREALRHLQQEGLVTAGNRGMLRVNSISPIEVREQRWRAWPQARSSTRPSARGP